MARGLLRVLVGAALVMFLVVIYILSSLPASASVVHSQSHFDHDDSTTDWSYGIVIDAGSTGSRLFLYKWQSLSDERLIDIHPALDHSNRAVVKKVTPGLSSFASHPENATEYMRPLLDYAVEFVPIEKRSYTPIFILATAGMRLVPPREQEAIMKNLHTNLPLITPMQVISDHIRVIEGKWEGVYSWIAVNYILQRFNVNGTNSGRQPTVGMVDMGGASVQIAVEVSPSESSHGDAFETVNLGCRDNDDTFKYRLFVTTFLGYGVNEGLRKYEQHLGDSLLDENGTQKAYVRDSCLPVNLVKTVSRKDGSQFTRKGFGNWDSCVDLLSELISKPSLNTDCKKAKCFLGQVLAPALSLSSIELYGFSEYWFSSEDVLSVGGVYNFTNVASKAREYCKLKWSTIQSRLRMKLYPKANEDRLRTQCFKSAWISAVLHTGFAVDKFSNHFQSVFNVNGQEVQWALGALLYHMRYFPLRDSQRRNLLDKRRRDTSSGRSSMLVLLAIAGLFIFVFVCLRISRGGKGMLRREPSMWGYMMLSQDQIYSSQYKIPSFS